MSPPKDSSGGDFGPAFKRRFAAVWSTGNCQDLLDGGPSTANINAPPSSTTVTIMPVKKTKVISRKPRSKPGTKKQGPKTGFFGLPLEVRDMIYTILLTEKNVIEPRVTCNALDVPKHCNSHRLSSGLQPQILRVNHQMHEEGTRILYGRNTFCFADDHKCCPIPFDDFVSEYDPDMEEFRHTQESHDFKLFLIDIGQQNRMLLRKLEFTFSQVKVFGRGSISKRTFKLGRYPGKSFSDGFKILALGHSLQLLHITVDGCSMAEEMEMRGELLDAICLVKNVPDLQINSTCSCDVKMGRNGIGNLRYKLTNSGGSQAYKFEEGIHKWNIWGKIQDAPALTGEASHEELAAKIQKLSSEQRVLETRIAEDTERRDYIAKMLETARGALML